MKQAAIANDTAPKGREARSLPARPLRNPLPSLQCPPSVPAESIASLAPAFSKPADASRLRQLSHRANPSPKDRSGARPTHRRVPTESVQRGALLPSRFHRKRAAVSGVPEDKALCLGFEECCAAKKNTEGLKNPRRLPQDAFMPTAGYKHESFSTNGPRPFETGPASYRFCPAKRKAGESARSANSPARSSERISACLVFRILFHPVGRPPDSRTGHPLNAPYEHLPDGTRYLKPQKLAGAEARQTISAASDGRITAALCGAPRRSSAKAARVRHPAPYARRRSRLSPAGTPRGRKRRARCR